jgi:anti-sigma factor RsiW
VLNELDPLRLHAYVDRELDLERGLEVEAACTQAPELNDELRRIRQDRERVREHAAYHRAPDALRRELESQLAVAAPARSRGMPQRPRSFWPRWLQLPAAFAACISLAAILVVLNAPAPMQSPEDLIAHDALASHARAVVSRHLVDVESSDHHTVKPWLSSRLDFSPPVFERPTPDSQLLGARIDYIDSRPVAAVVMRHAGHLVDVFSWPSAGSDSQPRFSADKGFRIASWRHAGLTHYVVSDLNEAEFKNFVAALRASQPS